MPQLAPNRATQLLGCRVPIVLAGMGGVARSALVALRGPANVLSANSDASLLARFGEAVMLVASEVGSVDEAIAAARRGASLIIAQGVEGGDDTRGTMALRDLLPALTDAVEVPVLAAGGLSSGGDLVIALALGAEGIVLDAPVAASRIEAIMADARTLLAATGVEEGPASASAVCYAGEMSGAYMGTLEPHEVAAALVPIRLGLARLMRETLARPTDAAPFSATARELAAWSLVLEEIAGDAASDAPTPTGLPALVGALGELVPRLPEGPVRERLGQLRRLLDERLMREIVATPRFTNFTAS